MPAIDPVDAEPRPFWSVMIPCHNNDTLLVRTLESVLVQDPGPDTMQIEVVDDASTDGDIAGLVRHLGAGRVSYFRQPTNVGPSANFTTCVRRAAGDWVHILHGDDIVLPGFYARYQQQIELCPSALMVAAQTINVDVSERHQSLTPAVEADSGYVQDAAFTIATRHPFRSVGVVVARRAYEQVGGFHPDLFHANDWEMWTRLASVGPVAWVDDPLGLYRDHPDSDTTRLHRSTAYLDDCLDAVEVIGRHFDRVGRRQQVRQAARGIVADYALAVARTLLDEGSFRLALANAVRSARIDPSRDNRSRAMKLAYLAVAATRSGEAIGR